VEIETFQHYENQVGIEKPVLRKQNPEINQGKFPVLPIGNQSKKQEI
jgi:hypothetical protein